MASGNDIYPQGPMEVPGEPMRANPPKNHKKIPKKILLAVLSIIVLVVLAFVATKFLSSDAPEPQAASQNTSIDDDQEAPDTLKDVPDSSAEKKSHTSDFPRVEFKYPSNWTVSENQKGIRVESPEFQYDLANGSTKKGNFRIYIRQGARQVDSTYIGRGVASKASEILTYSEPAPGQRTETNLSFFGIDSPDHFAFFFIAGNFTLSPGDTLGPDYGKEPETFIISGGYSDKSLTDDMATNPVSLDNFDKTNAYRQALDILKSLKVY